MSLSKRELENQSFGLKGFVNTWKPQSVGVTHYSVLILEGISYSVTWTASICCIGEVMCCVQLMPLAKWLGDSLFNTMYISADCDILPLTRLPCQSKTQTQTDILWVLAASGPRLSAELTGAPVDRYIDMAMSWGRWPVRLFPDTRLDETWCKNFQANCGRSIVSNLGLLYTHATESLHLAKDKSFSITAQCHRSAELHFWEGDDQFWSDITRVSKPVVWLWYSGLWF